MSILFYFLIAGLQLVHYPMISIPENIKVNVVNKYIALLILCTFRVYLKAIALN